MDIGAQIKAIRQQSLLSQETFAKELGVSFTTVNRWESGKCLPSLKTMKLINEFCKSNNIEFDISKSFIANEQK